MSDNPSSFLKKYFETLMEDFRKQAEEACRAYMQRQYPDYEAVVKLKITATPIISMKAKIRLTEGSK